MSEVPTPADDRFMWTSSTPSSFVWVGAKDLGEALCRIAEGASMIRM